MEKNPEDLFENAFVMLSTATYQLAAKKDYETLLKKLEQFQRLLEEDIAVFRDKYYKEVLNRA